MSDLQKAAADFQAHTTATANPRYVQQTIQQFKAFVKIVAEASQAAKSMEKLTGKAFGDYEDIYEDMKKNFVERGYDKTPNDRPQGMAHEDDFDDTPEGKSSSGTLQMLENLWRTFRGQGVARQLDNLKDDLQFDLDYIETRRR